MIYAISAVLFAVVFAIGFIIIRKKPSSSEKASAIISAVGFLVQIAINWLFLGTGMVHNPLAKSVPVEQTAIAFLVLCLVSIFCYAALLMVFYKIHEFYHE